MKLALATSEFHKIDPPLFGCAILELIEHARDRMGVRGITIEQIIRTIRTPDESGLPTVEGRERVRWNRTARKAIDVVYEKPENGIIRVITVVNVDRRIARRYPR